MKFVREAFYQSESEMSLMTMSKRGEVRNSLFSWGKKEVGDLE